MYCRTWRNNSHPQVPIVAAIGDRGWIPSLLQNQCSHHSVGISLEPSESHSVQRTLAQPNPPNDLGIFSFPEHAAVAGFWGISLLATFITMTSAKHKAALSVCQGSAAEAHSSWGFMVDLESEGKGQPRAQSPATQCWETKALEEVAAEASSSEVVLWKMCRVIRSKTRIHPGYH